MMAAETTLQPEEGAVLASLRFLSVQVEIVYSQGTVAAFAIQNAERLLIIEPVAFTPQSAAGLFMEAARMLEAWVHGRFGANP